MSEVRNEASAGHAGEGNQVRAMAWLGLFFATGCASVAPERGHDEVARLVAERAGAATGWETGAPEESATVPKTSVDVVCAVSKLTGTHETSTK